MFREKKTAPSRALHLCLHVKLFQLKMGVLCWKLAFSNSIVFSTKTRGERLVGSKDRVETDGQMLLTDLHSRVTQSMGEVNFC